MKNYKLQPFVTFEQIVAFRPEETQTHTASPLVDAVATILLETRTIRAGEIAGMLGVDQRALSGALQIATGLNTSELLRRYRLDEAQKYIAAHPDEGLAEVAHALGYASYNALWRFFQRALGITPNGKKSQAGLERWKEIRDDIRKGRY